MDSVSRRLPIQSATDTAQLRSRLTDVRDTVVVIAFSLIFRAALILKRCNY